MSKKRNIRYRELHNLDFRKYELTEEIISYKGTVLSRIRAKKDLPTHGVRKGDLGGFVQSTFNLSHKGDCWIKDNAIVYEKGSVKNNALVCGNAVVKGSSRVQGQAVVKDNACITSHAVVGIDAVVKDNARVYGYASIRGNAVVKDNAKVCASSIVDENMVISGDMELAVSDGMNHGISKREERKNFYREKARAERMGERERNGYKYQNKYDDYRY